MNLTRRGPRFTFQKRVPSTWPTDSALRLALPPCGAREAQRIAALSRSYRYDLVCLSMARVFCDDFRARHNIKQLRRDHVLPPQPGRHAQIVLTKH